MPCANELCYIILYARDSARHIARSTHVSNIARRSRYRDIVAEALCSRPASNHSIVAETGTKHRRTLEGGARPVLPLNVAVPFLLISPHASTLTPFLWQLVSSIVIHPLQNLRKRRTGLTGWFAGESGSCQCHELVWPFTNHEVQNLRLGCP